LTLALCKKAYTYFTMDIGIALVLFTYFKCFLL
jgi:hypothetical protein